MANWFQKTLGRAFGFTYRSDIGWNYAAIDTLLPQTDIDKEVAEAIAGAHTSSLVMACIEYLVSNATSTPWMMMGPDDEELEEHPVLDLLNQPSEQDDATSLLSNILISLSLAGNAFVKKVYRRNEEVGELQYLPHSTITIELNTDGTLSHYTYTWENVPKRIEIEDMIHIRRWSDWSRPYHGLSPLSYLGRELWLDNEATLFFADTIKNHGIPGLIVAPVGSGNEDDDPVLTPDDLKATQDYLQKNYTGEKRGRSLLFGRPMQIVIPTIDLGNMNLKSAHDYAEERISGAFGLPAAVVGFGSGAEQTKVGATLREMEQQAWRSGVIPVQNMIARQLTRALLGDTEYTLTFDRSGVGVLQEDENAKAERWDTLVKTGGVALSELREAFNMEVRPSDSVYLRPAGAIEVPVGTTQADMEQEEADRRAELEAQAAEDEEQDDDGQTEAEDDGDGDGEDDDQTEE